MGLGRVPSPPTYLAGLVTHIVPFFYKAFELKDKCKKKYLPFAPTLTFFCYGRNEECVFVRPSKMRAGYPALPLARLRLRSAGGGKGKSDKILKGEQNTKHFPAARLLLV